LMWGDLSDERTSLSFADYRQQSFSAAIPAWIIAIFYWHQIRHSPNLEGQVHVHISPRSRVTQLYSQALGYIFVASYDSRWYGGGIRNSLHTKSSRLSRWSLLYRLGTDHTENTSSMSSSVAAFYSLLRRHL
jgi:hypothetical protein